MASSLNKPGTSAAIARFLTTAIVLLPLVCGSQTFAQPRVNVSTSSQPRPAPAPAGGSDHRDVLVMLDGGPLHVRLHVALGGVSLAELRRQYVASLIERMDTNKDGKLARAEAQKSPLLKVKERPGAAKFLEGLKGQTNLTPRDVHQKIDVLGGELVAYREPPDSSKNDVEVFKLLDADKSGMLEPPEIEAAAELILSKDTDSDQCVSFEEFFPPPPPPDPMAVAAGLAEPAPLPEVTTVADNIRDLQNGTTPRHILKKYDKDRSFSLSAAELGWPAQRIATLDASGDGRLDAAELAAMSQATPDVEMVVDLRGKGSGGGLIEIAATTGQRLDDSSRLDYAKIHFGAAVVSFSHRNLDPLVSAIDDAMQQFNLLDADANGYLDRDEVAARIRFQRELFDLMDADADDKVFVDEMKAYVSARAEPAASTCRVNVYDTGNGFFMALDANADGRVSEREKRKAAQSLAQLDRDGKAGIGEKEPTRHFHIEFARGSYRLFGASEQLVSLTPAFQQRTPTGPIWFQRMDRNNDGDLIFDEFLGPLGIFDDLDVDHDELLDPQEASKAKAAASN
jgi:Ca2+-binding EF-hand superfamily protein